MIESESGLSLGGARVDSWGIRDRVLILFDNGARPALRLAVHWRTRSALYEKSKIGHEPAFIFFQVVRQERGHVFEAAHVVGVDVHQGLVRFEAVAGDASSRLAFVVWTSLAAAPSGVFTLPSVTLNRCRTPRFSRSSGDAAVGVEELDGAVDLVRLRQGSVSGRARRGRRGRCCPSARIRSGPG